MQELTKHIELMHKNSEKITEKYNSYDWNESMYDKVDSILNYVCKNYNNHRFNDYEYYSFIYDEIHITSNNNKLIDYFKYDSTIIINDIENNYNL